MTKIERARLITLVQDAVVALEVNHTLCREKAQRCATKYSPTNFESFRELSELVWWLIALDSRTDALRLLDALCAVNEEYYWMFQSLASTFATRAWLTGSETDHMTALDWLRREPNAKPVTTEEVERNIARAGDFIAQAAREKHTNLAAHTYSHALRLLALYSSYNSDLCELLRTQALQGLAMRLNAPQTS